MIKNQEFYIVECNGCGETTKNSSDEIVIYPTRQMAEVFANSFGWGYFPSTGVVLCPECKERARHEREDT